MKRISTAINARVRSSNLSEKSTNKKSTAKNGRKAPPENIKKMNSSNPLFVKGKGQKKTTEKKKQNVKSKSTKKGKKPENDQSEETKPRKAETKDTKDTVKGTVQSTGKAPVYAKADPKEPEAIKRHRDGYKIENAGGYSLSSNTGRRKVRYYVGDTLVAQYKG